jgi:hypothetical protein
MKKALFILMLLMILGIVFSYAQCGKKQTLTSSKTEYLDASGNLQRAVEESSTIELNDSSIFIIRGPEAQQMKGTVNVVECNWKTPFKEGKTYLKALITDERGEARNVTITIEGKDGQLYFLAESPERPDRKVRVVIDKFEEKK